MNSLSPQQRIRFGTALGRVGGDEDMLTVLAQMAAEDAPPMMNQLEAALENHELAAAAKTAHAFKGLLSTFETGSPVEDLQSVIDAARCGDLKTAKSSYRDIKIPLVALVNEVQQIV